MKKCVRQISIIKCLTKHEKIQTSKKNMSDKIIFLEMSDKISNENRKK